MITWKNFIKDSQSDSWKKISHRQNYWIRCTNG